MKLGNPMAVAFFAGWVFCSSLRAIMQDIVGKEDYILMVEEKWVSAAIGVPIAIVAILIASIGLYFAYRVYDRQTKSGPP